MFTYGLIGKTLKHSWSKVWFTEFFSQNNIDAQYLNFELDSINELFKLSELYPNLKGLNVTIPYKQQVIPLLDTVSNTAQLIGAVNTIKIIRDNRRVSFVGHNTDIIGFQKTIDLISKPVSNALVLGSGGASRAVCYVLGVNGIEYKIVSRSSGDYSYAELSDDIICNHNLIINTTPLGMFPDIGSAPKIPYHSLSDKHVLIDLVYNPPETLFLQKGRLRNTQIINGEKMLIEQAKASYEIWNS